MTVIFDLDGTLSDPAVGIGRSLNHALEVFGYRALSSAEISQYIGPPLDWAFRQIVPDAPDERVLALIAKYRERYRDIGYRENALYPGVLEALALLSSAGVRMGVCTSKRADFAEQILQMFSIRHHFAFVEGGELGITKDTQLRTLIERSVVCVTSTMVGDRAVDIEAARANGLRAVGVLWGHGSETELVAAGADDLLGSPAELARLLRGPR